MTDLEGTHAVPLKDVRERISHELADQEQNQRRADWINKLKSKILVRVF